MIKRYFHNYKDFKCIASKCPATCCSGWGIEIDEDSLESYRARTSADLEFLSKRIDWKESMFKQQPNGDCAFLRDDGLCQMYIQLGEASLCMTCDLYPRHIEEFPNVREYSLSASCPVVALDLMSTNAPLAYTEETDNAIVTDERADYEEFDDLLYEKLLACRTPLLSLLKNRTLPYAVRATKLLTSMRNVQDAIDDGALGTCEQYAMDTVITTDIQATQETSSVLKEVQIQNAPQKEQLLSASLFSDYEPEILFNLLLELEPLNPDFRLQLLDAQDLLFAPDFDLPDFESAFNEVHPDWEIPCEQLSVYFLFTYLCGAVYDNYVYAMGCQAIYNAYMIKLLWMAKWNHRKTALTLEELSQIVYLYSRELEHSTENMILLEELLDEF